MFFAAWGSHMSPQPLRTRDQTRRLDVAVPIDEQLEDVGDPRIVDAAGRRGGRTRRFRQWHREPDRRLHVGVRLGIDRQVIGCPAPATTAGLAAGCGGTIAEDGGTVVSAGARVTCAPCIGSGARGRALGTTAVAAGTAVSGERGSFVNRRPRRTVTDSGAQSSERGARARSNSTAESSRLRTCRAPPWR